MVCSHQVVRFAAGQEEADRVAQRVDQGVDLGAQSAARAMAADMLIADKAFDADARVLEPLAAAGKTAVIPPRANRSSPRGYDRQL